jgi:hypothetical protein
MNGNNNSTTRLRFRKQETLTNKARSSVKRDMPTATRVAIQTIALMLALSVAVLLSGISNSPIA